MSSPLVIFLLLIIAVAAFFFGRWHGMSQRSKALSEELKAKDEELNSLKENVNRHFDETARLFSNVTEEYKLLYQHLASSANKLGNRKFELKLSNNTTGLPGLDSNTSISDTVIDSEAKEITDYGTGPQQPRDYADDDMDDDYHPSHAVIQEENESEPDETVKSVQPGNSQTQVESDSSSDIRDAHANGDEPFKESVKKEHSAS